MASRKMGFAILTTVLVFAAVSEAYADDFAFARSSSERNGTMLQVLEMYPHYIIGFGDTVDQTGNVVRQMPGAATVEGANWALYADDLSWFIITRVRHNDQWVNRSVFMFSYESREEALQGMGDTTFEWLGPFDAGSTNASRQAALQRILAAVRSMIANPGAAIPQVW